MRLRRQFVLLAAFVTFVAGGALQADEPDCPYTVITKSGDRVYSMDPVRNSGRRVTFRLCPTRTLLAYSAAEIDWPATEKANASPKMTSTPRQGDTTPTPSLSRLAAGRELRDVDQMMALQKEQGKMKTAGGKTFDIDPRGPLFGKDSVAEHLAIVDLFADISDCPNASARVYAEVANRSRLKLRGIKAAVLIGNTRTGDKTERIESMDPADILPKETSRLQMFVSCDLLAAKSGYGSPIRRRDDVVVVLRDVSGRAEPLARPDPLKSLEMPTPKVKN
jgi:hypothetical protein